jgi:putative flippase GtrA
MLRIFRDFSSYSSVALMSAVSDWVVFVLLFQILGTPALWAQGVARIVGGSVSFGANRSWSFRRQQGHGLSREAARFLTLFVMSYCLSLWMIFALGDLLSVPTYLAKFSADTICFLFNFAGMRTYVFNRRQGISGRAISLVSRFRKPS